MVQKLIVVVRVIWCSACIGQGRALGGAKHYPRPCANTKTRDRACNHPPKTTTHNHATPFFWLGNKRKLQLRG